MEHVVLFHGAYIHCVEPYNIRCIENGIIGVAGGKIVGVSESNDVEKLLPFLPPYNEINSVHLSQNEFLCPGFVDLHLHGPQFPNAGLGYDKPLLEWLSAYTYPVEKKFSDVKYARNVYKVVVERILAEGTTTACYFGTIHYKSCIELALILSKAGQRAYVGKVNMNVNCPLEYSESTQESVEDTIKFIEFFQENLKDSLVKPIITPRFAVTCDFDLLKKLGELSAKYNLPIQTHISENKEEISFVRSLFPNRKNYTDVYNAAGLITPLTILAHGVHLEERELEVLKSKGATVVHCPISNTCLQSGLCNVRELLKYVNVGLGTDVAGGYSHSIIETMRAAITVSSHISMMSKEYNLPLNYHEAFYLATLGGAKALQLDNKIGNFIVGKDFDALRIDLSCKNSQINFYEGLTLEEKVQKFIFNGNNSNIRQVYIKGNLVCDKFN